jgi:hypothetical protein
VSVIGKVLSIADLLLQAWQPSSNLPSSLSIRRRRNVDVGGAFRHTAWGKAGLAPVCFPVSLVCSRNEVSVCISCVKPRREHFGGGPTGFYNCLSDSVRLSELGYSTKGITHVSFWPIPVFFCLCSSIFMFEWRILLKFFPRHLDFTIAHKELHWTDLH